MKQAFEPLDAAEWGKMVVFGLLMVVVLLAPFAPFVALPLVARNRPDLWEAYWHHPWVNGSLLSLALAAARVLFLVALRLLSTVLSGAILPAAFAWYPEMFARLYLADRGWDVSPRPDESLLRFYGIAFALNLAFWLGLLTLTTLARTLWRRGVERWP
jgi:hypothetical protein